MKIKPDILDPCRDVIRAARLYLAGPMRGIPEFNFPAFNEATKRLREHGFDVWSPAENDVEKDGFDPKTGTVASMAHYMERDLPEVCRADAVAVLPGWEKSQGATLEVHVCRQIGHPVVDAMTLEVIPWATNAELELTNAETVADILYRDSMRDKDGAAVATMRAFATGATRNVDDNKLDYEGFLSPIALEAYAQYLHKHRIQADGKLRSSDNWQLGIPRDVYIKSLFRHFVDVWKLHRGHACDSTMVDALSAVLFNANGYLHELMKENA